MDFIPEDGDRVAPAVRGRGFEVELREVCEVVEGVFFGGVVAAGERPVYMLILRFLGIF